MLTVVNTSSDCKTILMHFEPQAALFDRQYFETKEVSHNRSRSIIHSYLNCYILRPRGRRRSSSSRMKVLLATIMSDILYVHLRPTNGATNDICVLCCNVTICSNFCKWDVRRCYVQYSFAAIRLN